jgi:hypothetical protein
MTAVSLVQKVFGHNEIKYYVPTTRRTHHFHLQALCARNLLVGVLHVLSSINAPWLVCSAAGSRCSTSPLTCLPDSIIFYSIWRMAAEHSRACLPGACVKTVNNCCVRQSCKPYVYIINVSPIDFKTMDPAIKPIISLNLTTITVAYQYLLIRTWKLCSRPSKVLTPCSSRTRF